MADFYLDADLHPEFDLLLQRTGQHALVTARALRLHHAPDAEHLLNAAQRGRILLTHNRDDFVLLHEGWQRWSQAWNVSETHAGIVVIPHVVELARPQVAQELDGFLAGQPVLTNELYRLWRRSPNDPPAPGNPPAWYRWQLDWRIGGAWILA